MSVGASLSLVLADVGLPAVVLVLVGTTVESSISKGGDWARIWLRFVASEAKLRT